MRRALAWLWLSPLATAPGCLVDGTIPDGTRPSTDGAGSMTEVPTPLAGASSMGGKSSGSSGGMGSASGGKANSGGRGGSDGGSGSGKGGGGTSAGGSPVAGGAGAPSVDCTSPGGGECPAQGALDCPGAIQCGCQIVEGLGKNKCALLAAGGDRYFLAAAMLETQNMDATSYPPGDVLPNGSPKTGDAYNAGVCKQNWGMMRECYGPWQGLGQDDYQQSLPMRADRALDFKVYQACRQHFGDKWWGGHRNGSAGLENPGTQDIKNFKAGMDWTDQHLAGHERDDVRFWVVLPAIDYWPRAE